MSLCTDTMYLYINAYKPSSQLCTYVTMALADSLSIRKYTRQKSSFITRNSSLILLNVLILILAIIY